MIGSPLAVDTRVGPPPAQSAAPAALTVELRRDLALPPSDDAALDAMIDARPSVGVFVSKAWLSGYFAEPPDGTEPFLALIRDQVGLRAVVPIAVRHTLARVIVQFLGGGIGSDRVDLLAARGFEAACADAFLAWLDTSFGRGRFVLELRDVPADSPLWAAIHRAAASDAPALMTAPQEINPLPYLDLVEPALRSPDGGPLALNADSLAKHRRRLDRRSAVAVEMVDDVDDASEALDTLVALLHVRWNDGRRGSALDDQRALRFHRHALPLLLRERRLRMMRLSAAGRPIAIFYGLASARWWGYYLAGYDREWAGRIRLGQITLATAIDRAAQEGSAEFDFLKGAEPVKYLWAVRERASIDADVYSSGRGPQFVRGVRSVRDTAAAFAKSLRGPFTR